MVKDRNTKTQVAATCEFPSGLQGKSISSITDSEFHCKGNYGCFFTFNVGLIISNINLASEAEVHKNRACLGLGSFNLVKRFHLQSYLKLVVSEFQKENEILLK